MCTRPNSAKFGNWNFKNIPVPVLENCKKCILFHPNVLYSTYRAHVFSCVKPVRWRKHRCLGSNKKALIFMRFEHNEFKILILSFKSHLHIFWLNSFWSIFFFKHAFLRNFPEMRGTENSGLWLSVCACGHWTALHAGTTSLVVTFLSPWSMSYNNVTMLQYVMY